MNLKILKIPVISILFIAFFFPAKAQVWKFGISANPQVSWLFPDVKTIKTDGAGFGIRAGLIADKYFAKNYAISTGVAISSFGGRLHYRDSLFYQVHEDEVFIPSGSSIKYSLQYVEVPLTLKLKTNEIGYITYFADLGFTGQVLIKAKGNDSSKALEEDNIYDELRLFNLGYNFGAGIEYSLGGDAALLIGAKWINGFTDITSRKNEKVTTGILQLRVGFMF